ncbi:deoxyribose-phosphate aldolase [Synechococcus sp. KORDI-52]|uniref:deoxyribose-phosphate aldolase n=1 Tax=Synechococcus sp. KORDI-52 TaxID=585425 RepID=UPI0004E073A3|nr:deoxyribose-phosphate aldolase [Synechococcus sp. KORDI-52]AII48734.1 deoxyribose-phosphate aldolase [Synechococcus sp. KORDI-52]
MADPAPELPDLPPRLDQAILDPLLTLEQLQTLCDSGVQEGVRAICTTPQHLPLLRERIGGTDSGPLLVAAIGFPFGAIPAELKLAEAEWCAAHGAQEFDVVPDFSALVNGNSGAFAEELSALCDLGCPVRAILDMARLETEQLELAVEAAIDAGAAGLQTGNGFGPPCHADQIRALQQLIRKRCAIKGAGGIHNLSHAGDLLLAGADLLGTSSAPALLQAQRRPAA